MSYFHLGTFAGSPKAFTLKIPSGEGFQLVVFGGSGSGKTHLLHRIVELIPETRPLFIADPEQDFVQLRRHRDFVLVGKGRDVPADPAIAARLAKEFLERRFSIIFDAFEEKKKDAQLFLKNFLETVHDAPRALWQPATFLLDEFDMWAPERGEGESLCLDACQAAARRFRKRSFDIIIASTRIASVDKTSISQARNWLIGLANLDTDIKRSLGFLGFTEKEDRDAYRDLQRGEFYARGPDVGLRRPEKVTIGPAKYYERPSQKGIAARAPAPREQVKKLLQELADLPKAVQEDADERTRLRTDSERVRRELSTRITELERELRVARASGIPADQAEKLVQKGIAQGRAAAGAEHGAFRKKMEALSDQLNILTGRMLVLNEGVKAELRKSTVTPATDLSPKVAPPPFRQAAVVAPTPARERTPRASAPEGGERLGQGERLILNFLALRPERDFSKEQVGAMTGYAAGGGSFNTYVSRLCTAGLVERRGARIRLADGALELAADLLGEDFSVGDQRGLEQWLEKLGKGPRQIYELLLANPDKSLSKSELAEKTGYEAGGGSFNTYLSRLATLGLIERTADGVRLNPELRNL